MRLLDVIRPPDFAEDLPVRQHFSGVLDEQAQEPVFGGRELYFLPLQRDDAGGQIDFQLTRAKDRHLRRRLRVPLGDPQAGHQFAGAERFGHVVIRAIVQRGNLVFFAVAHREHQDRNAAPFAQPFEDAHAVHVGQTQVQQHQFGVSLRGFGEAVLAGGRFEYAVAMRFQTHAQQPANLHFVVYHQDDRLAGWTAAHNFPSAGIGGVVPSGKRIVKAAPPPARFSALTWPPWASTNPLTMESPKPVPPAGAAGARKNLSKTRWVASAGSPGPRSATVNRSDRSSTRALTCTAVPGGVCSAAFSSRLVKACCISTKSICTSCRPAGREVVTEWLANSFLKCRSATPARSAT